MLRCAVGTAVLLMIWSWTMTTDTCAELEAAPPYSLGHPRLYFAAEELARLRELRTQGLHARIWHNLADSADWCLTQTPRTDWIAPVTPDPIYLNLYDRFYAMMHDMAVMEHLAFAYAYSGEPRYLEGARQWALTGCRVWSREAEGEPDLNKAYAVTRLLKGLAVSYDLLYNDLPDGEREEIRAALVSVGSKYYGMYKQHPGTLGPEANKHHASVEGGSFGVAALTLLGEVPEAQDWLDLIINAHTDYLLPQALTPSGTQEQSSNYWASTMHYRLFFMDALRRVTGRDLFKDYAQFMDGRIALAAVAGPQPAGYSEDNQSILFGPSYGQLDYWSPVLLYLAREYRRPIYQHLALWDGSLGAIQKTRYITPNGEQLLFEMGGYVYAWYDPTVPDRIERGLPRSFAFPEVNEVYARSSYRAGAIVVAASLDGLIVHAGGRPVLISLSPPLEDPKLLKNLSLTDERNRATIEWVPASASAPPPQVVQLRRPNTVTVVMSREGQYRWWCQGTPTRDGNTLVWADGTTLRLVKGTITSFDPEGYQSEKIVGMGKLKCLDPMPMKHPLVTADPQEGEMALEVRA